MGFSDQRVKLYKNANTVISSCGVLDIPGLQTQHLFVYAHFKVISSLLYFPSNTVHLSKQKNVHSI